MLELLIVIILIILSFVLLIKGADFLVDGAADFAHYFRVSPILVGLTIVAFGTSLPELMVSLFSAIGGYPDLSVGNIVGSNIFNIALIIGISAAITGLAIRSRTLLYEFPFMVISGFLLIILSIDLFIYGKNTFILSRTDGLILLAAFAIFIYYILQSMKKEHLKNTKVGGEFRAEFDGHKNKNPLWKNSLLIVGGLLALVIGGKLFVNNAVKLIAFAGLTESFIGLTIAAAGTSFPELFTSAIAAYKKHSDIAIGNIIGSNIFNILFVLGITSLIHPIKVSQELLSQDMIIMFFISLIFLVFATTNKKISRKEGIVLLGIYLLYLIFLFWRM